MNTTNEKTLGLCIVSRALSTAQPLPPGLTDSDLLRAALLSRSKDGLKTVGKKLEGLIQEEGNELIAAKQKSLAATKKSKSVDLVKKSLPLIKELTKL